MEADPAPAPPTCPACALELEGSPVQCPRCHHDLLVPPESEHPDPAPPESAPPDAPAAPRAGARSCGSCGYVATSRKVSECPNCKGYKLSTPDGHRNHGCNLIFVGGVICLFAMVFAIYFLNTTTQPSPDWERFPRRTDLDHLGRGPLRGAARDILGLVLVLGSLAAGIAFIRGGLRQQATGQPALPRLKSWKYAIPVVGLLAFLLKRCS